MTVEVSPVRRREIVDALGRGTVPARGLDVMAVGLDRFAGAIDDELAAVAAGGASFKAIRGEWGSGKTFASRWIAERARRAGFATAEIQISETETPLHHLQTVYRRIVERLSVGDGEIGALRSVVDGWFYVLEEDVLASKTVAEADTAALDAATTALMEQRLASVTRTAPMFGAVLRAYRTATSGGDAATADGLLAWLGGQPNVAASIKRAANVKGEIDHTGAFSFLQGLLLILRDSGHAGLFCVIDEVETLQRVRSDARDKSLNALRQMLDEIDGGRFPGLLLVITGTPAFFDGPQGIQRLAPLAQRLATDFTVDARFDNPRAVQLRLAGFDRSLLHELGVRIRDVFAAGARSADRVRSAVDDSYVDGFAEVITGKLGGKVGIAPRLFCKKLVDVLQRVDEHPEFDPRTDYSLKVSDTELSDVERNAAAGLTADDVDLDLGA
ncbi:MAG TPA: BREX system ATP-binding protein BrxD [Acidimicrobiales bacterium]|nr:BREX system ATP-binding protein BrxD [Acidimicrobiales bacterium]